MVARIHGAAVLGDVGADAVDLEADVDAVDHALLIRVFGDQVALEEAQRVRRRGGRQADQVCVEVLQHLAPQAVDRAVAFVGDHHVEVAAGVFLVAADHGLQQADCDLFFLLDHARLEPVAGIVGQQILNGLDGLFCELIPVDQEKDALGLAGLDQPLQVESDQVGLAATGRQFDQEAALSKLDRAVERLHGALLVGTQSTGFALTQISVRDRHRGQWLAFGTHVNQTLQVAPGEE